MTTISLNAILTVKRFSNTVQLSFLFFFFRFYFFFQVRFACTSNIQQCRWTFWVARSQKPLKIGRNGRGMQAVSLYILMWRLTCRCRSRRSSGWKKTTGSSLKWRDYTRSPSQPYLSVWSHVHLLRELLVSPSKMDFLRGFERIELSLATWNRRHVLV